ADQCLLGRLGELTARGDKKGAASHRRIEDAQAEDLIGRSSVEQRGQSLANEIRRERARRVERTCGLSEITRASKFAVPRLVFEYLFVNRAQFLHVEVAIGDPHSRVAA